MKVTLHNKMKMCASSNSIFYRGIVGEYDQAKERKLAILWITKDVDYARIYGDNILKYKANIRNIFNLPFRTTLAYVKYKDITKVVQMAILKMFRESKLSEDKAKSLIKKLRYSESKKHKSDSLKRVWEWFVDNRDLVDILLSMNIDAISALEGKNDSTRTYGIINKKILHKVGM